MESRADFQGVVVESIMMVQVDNNILHEGHQNF